MIYVKLGELATELNSSAWEAGYSEHSDPGSPWNQRSKADREKDLNNLLIEIGAFAVDFVSVLEELQSLRKRFHSACIASGSDAEMADAACAGADAAIAKAMKALGSAQ